VSVVNDTAREAAAALAAAVVGAVAWALAVLVGVSADVVGVVFYREADYPSQDAWMFGSTVLAAVVAGLTWWLARSRREPTPINR
jgi:membrane protein DedA with SNARE-associated domain